MFMYWAMFLAVALATVLPFKLPLAQSRAVLWGVAAVFACIIGLRHEVGGDWFNYLPHYLNDGASSLLGVLRKPDPAYHLLNWISARLDGGVYLVNLVCASILMYGIARFCNAQPNRWLALAVSVPYLVVVVGMGYTRQSVAIGCVLVGLEILTNRGRIRSFVAWIILGALFHKSAVLILPIAALAATRNRWLTLLLICVISFVTYYLLVADHAEAMWETYVGSNLGSEGGLARVTMSAFSGVAFILFGRRMVADHEMRTLWMWLAVFALACVPLVFVASTAVDRIALYFIPLQLFVLSRTPRLVASAMVRTAVVAVILFIYAGVLFVWLNFATHAAAWIPYEFALPKP